LLLPLIGALLVTSIASGRLITRTGHYKAYPVAGTALAAAGPRIIIASISLAAAAAIGGGITAAVIGKPDERLGEEVVAVVALRPGHEVSA